MRTLGLPSAAIAVIAIPFVIVAAREPDEPAAPDPVAAALTVHLAGDEGGAKPAYIHLTAAGQPPAEGERFRLVDSTGLHAADAEVVATDICSDEPVRRTGVAGETNTPTWCLELESVDAGRELKGSVTGEPGNGDTNTPATKLALTVTRRDAFLSWPLLTLVAGLLAGALAILVPRTVRSYVQEVSLGRVVAKNRDAGPTEKIQSLDEWVGDQLRKGTSLATLAPVVASIVENGPNEASRARQKLKDAWQAHEAELQDPELPANPTFMQGAQDEAERTDHAVSDFLAADGKKVAHPGDVWTEAVTRLAEMVGVLTSLDARIEGELVEECRDEPRIKLAEARATLDGLEEPEDLGRLEPRVNAVRTAFENERANDECLLPGLEATEQPAVPTLSPAPDPAHSMITTGKGLGAATGAAVFWTLAIAAVTIAFAGLTVYFAAYYGKNTFNSSSDYFALFAAALGSSAAASIFAVLAYWEPGAAEEPA